MPVASWSAPRSGTAERAGRPADPGSLDGGAAIGDGAFRFVVAIAAVALLVAIAIGGFGAATSRSGGAASTQGTPAAAAAGPTATPGPFLYAAARSAPPIDLIDAAERPVSLSGDRGSLVLVFFGYTHCPDVCPATIGILGKVLADLGGGGRALFVSIDPERDTPSWLREYAPYLPAGFTALTGSAAAIRTTADAWNVRYARVETDQPDAYSMSHTADVFIVDPEGRLRGAFPFGTTEATMVATLRAMPELPGGANAPPSSGGTPSPTPVPTATVPPSASVPPSAPVAGALRPTVVSSSIWAGGRSPLILALDGPDGRIDDPALAVDVGFVGSDGTALGPPVRAVAVRPPLEDRTLYVATLDVATAGSWQLEVSAAGASGTLRGSVAIAALDPGSTAPLGRPAPGAATPTLDDVGGDHWAVSTDPAPDLRLYGTSTAAALANHQPFVLVVDFGPLPRLAGVWQGRRDGPLPARPMAVDRVHPPRAVSLPGDLRDARTRW